jgi:hypothetical protein
MLCALAGVASAEDQCTGAGDLAQRFASDQAGGAPAWSNALKPGDKISFTSKSGNQYRDIEVDGAPFVNANGQRMLPIKNADGNSRELLLDNVKADTLDVAVAGAPAASKVRTAPIGPVDQKKVEDLARDFVAYDPRLDGRADLNGAYKRALGSEQKYRENLQGNEVREFFENSLQNVDENSSLKALYDDYLKLPGRDARVAEIFEERAKLVRYLHKNPAEGKKGAFIQAPITGNYGAINDVLTRLEVLKSVKKNGSNLDAIIKEVGTLAEGLKDPAVRSRVEASLKVARTDGERLEALEQVLTDVFDGVAKQDATLRGFTRAPATF